MIKLGQRVRALRESRAMTQEVLAGKTGISRNFISRIENGDKGVGLDTLIALADAFEVSVSELFLGVHKASPPRLASLSAAVAGQPAEVQARIFRVLEELLAFAADR